MARWGILIIGFLLASYVCCSQDHQELEKPDVDAEYPGGFENLYLYLFENMRYPASAIIADVEGKVFISFIVGADGLIENESVKIVSGLFPECDSEAERVIKSIKEKWRPAVRKGEEIRQRFTIPVEFKLSGESTPNAYTLRSPIKTTIKFSAKEKNKIVDWDVYSDVNMKNKSGKLSSGDSILITGIAPYLFIIIRNKSSIGYISYKAPTLNNPDLEIMYDKLEKNSSEWDDKVVEAKKKKAENRGKFWKSLCDTLEMEYSSGKVKDLQVGSKPTVFLQLTSKSESIVVGECTTIDLSLFVNTKNTKRLHFIDLPNQLDSIVKNNLASNFCWIARTYYPSIEKIERKIANESFYVYPLYTAAYCPIMARQINFNPISIKLEEIVSEKNRLVRSFTASSISVKVNSLSTGGYVGHFVLRDTLMADRIIMGKPYTYKLTIKGEGITFPIVNAILLDGRVKHSLISQTDSDTILNSTYYSSKTFVYSIIFNNSETINMGDFVKMKVYNPKLKRTEILKSNLNVQVLKGINKLKVNEGRGFNTDFIIALDISQSMSIEDYSPNRLGMCLKGLELFLKQRKECNIGLILFGGNAYHYNLSSGDSCYAFSRLKEINRSIAKAGTAIGDAIWLGANSLKNGTTPKKMVIIGDGENTSGYSSPSLAVQFALKNKLAVYAIGVGHNGSVKVGSDYFGKPYTAENTFSDKHLRKISTASGGKYYWTKNSQALANALIEIFK